MIRRLQAQRSCLNAALSAVADGPGVIFELGLGNGRTFDHLRENAPTREIYVFEREVRAHPDCIPDDDHLFVGNLEETLPSLIDRFEGQVALIHSDVGTSEKEYTPSLKALFVETFHRLLTPDGLVVSDKVMSVPTIERIEPPGDVPTDRYFMYRLVRN